MADARPTIRKVLSPLPKAQGPRLDALKDPAALQTLRAAVDHAALEPVYETIAQVRQDLPPVRPRPQHVAKKTDT